MFGQLNAREKWLFNGLLLISAIFWVIPLYYLVAYSFGGDGFSNYVSVISLDLFPRFLMNSTIVAIFVVVILDIVVVMGAFGFSKLKFPGKDMIFNLCLVGLMIPHAAMLVPMFQTIKNFGWINEYSSLIGPEIAFFIPFSLLITRNFFDEIPNALLEAARIDGSSTWGQFYHIILPLGIPIITTISILAFLNSWNEFLLPLAFITNESMQTVTMAPKFFIQEYTADYHKVFAAMVLISIPIIVIYLFGQKYLQRGLTSGAIK